MIESGSAQRTPRGFTLIEVLVVLALITLSAIMILPRVAKPLARTDPPAVEYLKRQQAFAVLQGMPVEVYFQGDRLYSLPSKASHEIAANEQIRILEPGEPVVGPGQLLVRFWPDGSMSFGQAELRIGTLRTKLSFSPLGGFTSTYIDDE